MTEMTKAVCWELASANANMNGMRVLLAGQHVGTQTLTADNQRPRWKFLFYSTAGEASQAAIAATETFEREWSATLVIPPGEIALHPSEVQAMQTGNPISPSLRARIFTSLSRRDPRLSTVAAPGGGSRGE